MVRSLSGRQAAGRRYDTELRTDLSNQGGSDINKDLSRRGNDVAAFLNTSRVIRKVVAQQPRLLFALDATASREPTWAQARRFHREMFAATQERTLAIQLAYYRGLDEFQVSPWLTRPEELVARMEQVTCRGGPTQLMRLLQHYIAAGTPATPVRAMVFIGDAVEEPTEQLMQLAGECRLRAQPVFLFQEGNDQHCATTFEQAAHLSGGAYARFDQHSAARLAELLGAVARFASGGRKALTRSGRDSDTLLLSQLPPES